MVARVLRTSSRPIAHFAPVYHNSGKYGYKIEKVSNTEYRATRANSLVYGHGTAEAVLPDKDAALAWCQSDFDALTGQVVPTPNPPAVINNLDPRWCRVSEVPISININGEDFDETCVVLFDAVPLATEFVGQARLRVSYDPVAVAIVPVTVQKEGAVLSNVIDFEVRPLI